MSEQQKQNFGARTNLGRIYSFRYPKHRWVAVIAALAGALAIGYRLLDSLPLLEALGRGFNASLAAFIAWVLARELDPPREWTGLVAAALGGLAALLLGPVPLLASGFLILLLRLVNHSAGGAFTRGDSIFVALAALAITAFGGEWLIGAATATAFLLDGWLDPVRRRRQWGWAALVALGTIAYLFLTSWPTLSAPITTSWAIAALATLFSLVRLARYRQTDLGPNDAGGRMEFQRVAVAVSLALATAFTALWLGEGNPNTYAVLWSALIAVGF